MASRKDEGGSAEPPETRVTATPEGKIRLEIFADDPDRGEVASQEGQIRPAGSATLPGDVLAEIGRDLAPDEFELLGSLYLKRKRSARGDRTRARTIAARRLTKEEMRQGALLESPAHRPLIRRDCLTATEARELYREDDGLGDGMNCARPCPFVRCRHHLYLDANPNYGSIKLNFPHLELWELKESCALDVADRGGITLEEVGVITNLTRERVRQVEVRGLLKLKQTAAEKLEVEGHGVPAAKADDPDAVWRTPEFRHKAAAWPDQRDRELALLVCAGASVAKAAARVGMGREAVELVLQKIARWGGRTTDKVA